MTVGAHRLVLGDDGSSGADVAWLWIIQHAWTGWSLDVVTATDGLALVRDLDEVVVEEWDSPHPRVPPDACGFASVVHLITEADARLALASAADLLVIGPRGTGLLKTLHLGSVAEWLLQHPPSPLVVARHGRAARSVLVCADGSTHSRRAIDTFASLPLAASAAVTVLGVDDGRRDPAPTVTEAETLLRPRCASTHISLAEGIPTNEILRWIEEHDPDLVVMGTRGLTGWDRMRLGSTAGSVARVALSSLLLACDDGP